MSFSSSYQQLQERAEQYQVMKNKTKVRIRNDESQINS